MSRKIRDTSHLGLVGQVSRQPAKPPGLLRVIQRNCSGHYEQLLAHLFSSVDDLFYDLSKRASSNQEQNLYFEAMREIRIKREGIANQFLRALATAFSKLLEQPVHRSDEDWENDLKNPLSIVKGDDLEVELAISNMVSRTRDAYRFELHELETRLDHLLLHAEINPDENPLNPLLITKAFVNACEDSLDTGIKAKLILFKLFEKHVLKQLGHIYADANRILLEAGILPKIPSSLQGRERDRDSASSLTQDRVARDISHVDQLIDQKIESTFCMQQGALNLLMEAARGFARSSQGSVTPQQSAVGPFFTPQYYIGSATQPHTQQTINCYVYSSNPGSIMSSPELAQQLTQSQSQMDLHLLNSRSPQNLVSTIVHELLAKGNPKKPHALNQSDENIINLVSMFFDQILADESLHVVVQTLICRLQIPILKVALKDKTFFSQVTHPARKLINSITALGVGFDENKPIDKDPVYRKISEIVKALNTNYRSEDDIFSVLQSDLDAFVDKEKRKAKIVEQRTTQTEEGKARIKQARIATQDLIYRKLKDVELPDTVKNFLITHWLQVMVVTNLKKGMDSNEWAANEQAITDLVWISKAHTDARSIQRRERMLPEVLDRLEVDLEAVIANPLARQECITVLEQALKIDVIDGVVSEAVPSPLSEDQKDALGKGGDAPKAWSEMTAVEKQKIRYEELSAGFYDKAKNIAVGTWLEYGDAVSGKPIRCKIASKVDADTYLFINRLGFKVLERTRKQFAYDMQSNRARILDTRPLFDRIMDKVVGNLSVVKS